LCSQEGCKVTDLDHEIWNNPTLGAAAHNENLTRLEKQQHEDRAAEVEGREPRQVIIERTYPDWTPPVAERTGTVPSNYQEARFADEQQNDVPVDSAPFDETAGALVTDAADYGEPDALVAPEESEPTTTDSTPESDSTE
jgi:hypothetical protein